MYHRNGDGRTIVVLLDDGAPSIGILRNKAIISRAQTVDHPSGDGRGPMH